CARIYYDYVNFAMDYW
nr:immunoglobulin heavy chain junction region [Mus musculus]